MKCAYLSLRTDLGILDLGFLFELLAQVLPTQKTDCVSV